MSEAKVAREVPEVKRGNDRPTSLITKLVAVMGAVDRVAKRGKNEVHGYKYATEADIADEVRRALVAEGVLIIPSVLKTDWRMVKGKTAEIPVCVMEIEFTVTDGKEERKFIIVGSGMDSGDKGPYKAMTGAEKYALLKLFLIPTGDDPERDDDERRQERKSKTKAPEPARPKPDYETITAEQAKRLWAVAGNLFPKEELPGRMKMLLASLKVDSTPEIPADRFEEALAAIQEVRA